MICHSISNIPGEPLKKKKRRDIEIQDLAYSDWSLENVETKLGPVPAVMIKNAKKGLVKISLNFDGEHVDLQVVKQAVDLIGAENLLMMTDAIESGRLAGRKLYRKEGSTLLYQDQGIVAAGSCGIVRQIQNMLTIGLSVNQIEKICCTNPAMLLANHNRYILKNIPSTTH